jgi:Reverse transcriptase (RNA-dependent DNA polymerase)
MKTGKLWLVAAVYVDDIIYARSSDARKWFNEQVKTRFKIVELGPLSKHLGVWYERKKDCHGSYYELSMTKYQGDIIKDWEEVTGTKTKMAKTPGYPGETLIRDKEGEVVDIENSRKILGKAMWFCKNIGAAAMSRKMSIKLLQEFNNQS